MHFPVGSTSNSCRNARMERFWKLVFNAINLYSAFTINIHPNARTLKRLQYHSSVTVYMNAKVSQNNSEAAFSNIITDRIVR